MADTFHTEKKAEAAGRAVLVGIAKSQKEVEACERSLDELSRLVDTAGGVTVARMIQVKDTFEPATCIGKGKVEELKALCKNHDVDLVVFDFELSPSQVRNLEDGTDTHVIDRTVLILDIFALHAVTGEGKLQVELAQLRYTAPRLIGKGTELSRLGGGIGTRGPGESKLESDRRHIARRIAFLEAEIASMEDTRNTMRASRDASGVPKIAIVGYTNAGKSTLLNRLTDAGVLSENKLFATLDPTTRRLSLPEGEDVLLTDTVGLIRRLPHQLVKAFHSTLKEAALADILLIVCDASDTEVGEHLAVTGDLLNDLGAGDKPTVIAYNKCDRVPEYENGFPEGDDNTVFFSAATGKGIDRLLSVLLRVVRRNKQKAELFFPYTEQAAYSKLCNRATVESFEYQDEGVAVTAILDTAELGAYRKYLRTPLAEVNED